MKTLPKKYNAGDAQARWRDAWLKTGVYGWDASQPRENSYVIDTPPPTVSGHLHMGHIFSYTQADFIARYQRMTGKTVFYPMGFDDNGLPTERLVEKTIKKRAIDLGREAFIEECEQVAEDARNVFRELFQTISLSVDWDQEYHTISDQSRRLSQLSFLDLYHKGRAYRELKPMFWDPVDQTAIAQAEIEDKELESHENYLIFGLDDGSGERVGEFQVMTTRPEMLPACIAVMCDPKDAKKYEGLQAIRPISGTRVPIIPDDRVDADKGTGMVMCCTFGDETDVYWYEKHRKEYNLPLPIILNRYGKFDAELMDAVLGEPAKKAGVIELLAGLTVKKARNEVFIEALEKDGSLAKREPITHAVKCAERSGAPLEILPTEQWFIKILDQKEALKEKIDECTWRPDFMRLRAHQWVDGLSWDWCISRQRYFGVPFPVWYSKRAGEEGKILLPTPEQLPVNPLVDLPEGYSADEVVPEADVMDTWATSSVSPQLSSHGITQEHTLDAERHAKLFPADLRPQAHEIIRTWAFYTIVKAHLHEDTIPWENLMISGWCLAEDKTKMSKSKGNVVTPLALIEEHGTDAVRYWASTSRLGADTAFSTDLLKIGRKLVTKLWNASKFAAIQLENLTATPAATAAEDVANGAISQTIDLWILARLHRAITRATEQFNAYEYCAAREAIEDFFWNDFCDNYLEIVKKRAYGNLESGSKNQEESSSSAKQQSAVLTIYHCLETTLRLFAPFVPFVTEELYSHLFDEKFAEVGSIHARGNWPSAADYPANDTAEAAGIAARQILDVVRKAKGDAGVSIKWPIDELHIAGELDLTSIETDLAAVTNASTIHWNATDGDISEDGQWTINTKLAAESDAA